MQGVSVIEMPCAHWWSCGQLLGQFHPVVWASNRVVVRYHLMFVPEMPAVCVCACVCLVFIYKPIHQNMMSESES